MPKPTPQFNKRIRKGSQSAIILTTSENIENLKSTPKRNPKIKNVRKNLKSSMNASGSNPNILNSLIEIDESQWYCEICEEVALEDMIQCARCKKWFHEACAKPRVKSCKKFICIICESNK